MKPAVTNNMDSDKKINESIKNTRHEIRISITKLIILLLLILLIAGIALLTDWENKNKKMFNDYAVALNDQHQQLLQYQNNVEEIAQKVESLKQQQVSENEASKQRDTSWGWQLDTANYLVHLAQYHLLYSHDISSALALLRTADQYLEKRSESEPDKVRTLLAKDITLLQAIPTIDKPHLLKQLDALQEQIAKLKINIPSTTARAPVKATDTTAPLIIFEKIMKELNRLVVIHRAEETDEFMNPVLSLQQQIYLQKKVQLALQQAQWCVLQNQQMLYQQSLLQAKQWIQRYFSHQEIQAIIKTIDDLQTTNLQPEMPDLSMTVQAMQELISRYLSPSDKLTPSSTIPG